MMKMNRALAALGLVCAVGGAQAALVGRDINGNAVVGSDASSVFLYDTVLNVTWLRDANRNGAMTWDQANTWATNLTVGSYAGWRLPTMVDTGAPGCNYAYSGTDCGYNSQTTIGSTVLSELAALFYNTLGNKALYDWAGAVQAGYGLTNTGDFQNMQSYGYWDGLEYALDPSLVWHFEPSGGLQAFGVKDGGLYALAVRDGDVLVTPIPAAAWLMLSGVGALGAVARLRKSPAVSS